MLRTIRLLGFPLNPVSDEIREKVVSLVAEGVAKTKIARQLDVGEATVYRILAARKTLTCEKSEL